MNWKRSERRGRVQQGVAGTLAALIVVAVASPLRAGSVFNIESVTGHGGTTISVPVTLRGETNVVALQADVHFDPAALRAGAVVAGTVAANRTVIASDLVPGVRRLVIYSLTSTPMTNGAVATLDFTLDSGTSQNALRLSLSNVILVTAVPAAVASTNGDGLIVFNPVSFRADGALEFYLAATARQTNIVQASTDLEQWTDIGNVVPTTTALEFADTSAKLFARRFYRVKPQPAP